MIATGIELHRLACDQQELLGRLAQQLTQLVQRLAQVLLGDLIGLIGPEQCGQRLARMRACRLKREIGQQRLEPGGLYPQRGVIDSCVKGTQEHECKPCHPYTYMLCSKDVCDQIETALRSHVMLNEVT